MKAVYITDCEGPITKNDNAFELSSHFIPDGARFFSILSRYDDLLAYTYRRKEYKAGNTLKLIVPFLKAYGVTDQEVSNFCKDTILLVPGADRLLGWVSRLVPTFLISTSYEPYIHTLCELLRFPKEQTFSTKLNLDGYKLSPGETNFIKRKFTEIMQLPELPEAGRKSSSEIDPVVEKIDNIFEELSRIESGAILREVNPIGGEAKAEKVLSIVRKLNCEFEEIIYVGDSITDVDAFNLVRERNGLTISFNGNRYAVEASEIAVMSKTAEVLRKIISTFLEGKKKEVMKLIERWDNLEYPKCFLVAPENFERISEESSKLRKSLRGERIGALG